ncbi:cleavage and polyadenylation specificity factor subunit 5, partial [Lecanoromycetidae sp. Uapishka_2]
MSTVTGSALQTSYPPILPKAFDANQPPSIRLFPLSNYTFGTKETQPEEDPSVVARLERLKEHYEHHGMRRTCEGILVCHEHNHPHILMLQIANAFFKLPGDYLQAEDDEIEGFKLRLNERLAPVGSQFSGEGVNDEWHIAIPHLLSRYNFEFMDEEGNVCAATPGGDPGPQPIKVLTKDENGDEKMNGHIKEEEVNGYGEGGDKDVDIKV